ncbi:MAG TPA: LamG domain-containing protein [Kofleriaceae bacterium]|nr:LamG domain-containing protein [Kofleriaceae bacterium]
MRRIAPSALLALTFFGGVALADGDPLGPRGDRRASIAVRKDRHGRPFHRGRADRRVSRDALQLAGATAARASTTATPLTSGITLEAWVRWDSGTGVQAVMYNGNSATSGYGLFLENGRVKILAGGVDWAPCSTCKVVQGEWTHLAAVRTDKAWFVYQNGAPQALDNATLAAHVPSGQFSIASVPAGGERLIGAIDEVRVWSVARSPREIEDDYALSLAGDEPGLLHYYRIDEREGSVLHDVRGTLPVTLLGEPAWVTSGPPLATARR